MKYGLEKEFFLLNAAGEVQMIPPAKNYPHDGCGLLLEARGAPIDDFADAVFLMRSAERKIVKKVETDGYFVSDDPLKTVPRDVHRQARRIYTKDVLQFQNLYGFTDNRHKQGDVTAAIHIRFTMTHAVIHEHKVIREVNRMWDFPQLFRQIDQAFKEEIKAARRNPGFYELKPDGRIEYRSLPSNVNLTKLLDVMETLLTKRGL